MMEKFNFTTDCNDKLDLNTKKDIQDHIDLAKKLNKPAVLEELGLNRDVGYTPNTPVTSLNKFFKFVFKFVKDAKENGSPLAGCNFWAWGGEGQCRTR